MDILHEKLALLMENIKAMGSVAVAFSGGVDSTFLMKAAHKALGDKAVAVTARSHAISEREWKEAEELAKAEGIRHVMFDFPECDLKEFAQNPPDRCYYCKTVILRRMWEVAKQEGIAEIVEGSNADDESDYRPGMRAVKEQKVKSPLKKAGLTKAEIRELSKEWGLPTWEKQSAACLASRFAYGEVITVEKLRQVEKAEEYLRGLGFGQLRVRVHGNLARLELTEEDIKKLFLSGLQEEIDKTLKKLGYIYVTLDLRGYRMGSMNEVLTKK
ncbi:ATP-dependent sacrificial sulfur transferase LarE [Clostridiaceae bacterium AM27-36LB]|nr:ATP-dependent sacrificial sulfur transferase LarE [Clostridiales bacterium AM23-16LB]RHR44707.1 ATP-dependent sacrificial sulfur transferase LarE [Clostridiaceae bacterium AF18-31LB]RHT82321.1 ATP-dependent sacrificial sulfur transferase LarE [Clostridiaceae bacterium AM27-36LB]RHW04696.1 ATP-dependent sacrificial sulfur transferase LarE [Clostridiaceae bacterium OF09-1]